MALFGRYQETDSAVKSLRRQLAEATAELRRLQHEQEDYQQCSTPRPDWEAAMHEVPELRLIVRDWNAARVQMLKQQRDSAQRAGGGTNPRRLSTKRGRSDEREDTHAMLREYGAPDIELSPWVRRTLSQKEARMHPPAFSGAQGVTNLLTKELVHRVLCPPTHSAMEVEMSRWLAEQVTLDRDYELLTHALSQAGNAEGTPVRRITSTHCAGIMA